MAPSYIGDFSLRGAELRKKGINRIGNLLVPNNNYCQLEEWILPVWDKMLEEQKTQVYKILELLDMKLRIICSISAWSSKWSFELCVQMELEGHKW